MRGRRRRRSRSALRGAWLAAGFSVARGDVGHDDIWQRAGAVQLLARPRNLTAFRQLLQRASERSTVGALEAEGARNLARADLSGLAGDEGEDLIPGGQSCGARLGARGLGARGLGAGRLGAGTVHGVRCSLRRRFKHRHAVLPPRALYLALYLTLLASFARALALE